MRALKGHGTGNDFVVLPDLDGRLELTDVMVQRVCDRRHGLGGDGILRVVRSASCDDPAAEGAEYFMDYRNADGSPAQMCGNGIRVFARFLVEEGLADPQGMEIATRGGVRTVQRLPDGQYAVAMGEATPLDGAVSVVVGNRSYPATGVHVPNPHAVAVVASLEAAGALSAQPEAHPAHAFPEGTNVEFVHEIAPGHIAMRVFERGVGETQSCGTGACAAAWVHRRHVHGVDGPVRVDVPGGTLHVDEGPDGLTLIGPAVIVADATLAPEWLTAEWAGAWTTT